MGFFSIAKTILSSLFKKEATVEYPFKPMPKDPIVRGHLHIDINDCIFCGICGRKCPTHAIAVSKSNKEWEIEQFQCIVCGACTEACPKKCLYLKPELTPASDERIRYKATPDA